VTDDKTQVETDELRAWSRGARDRGDRMAEAADAINGINLGHAVFGVVSQAFAGDLRAKVAGLADQVHDTATYVGVDANNAKAVADSFDEVDQTQADRFAKGGQRC
jgi:hypothetical protein